MANTKKIAIIRTDNSGCQPPFIDVVSIPAEFVDGDPTGCNAMSFLERVIADYLKEHPDWKDEPTWDDFFTIPDEWLAERNIDIKPVDVPVTLEVGMDEEVELP